MDCRLKPDGDLPSQRNQPYPDLDDRAVRTNAVMADEKAFQHCRRHPPFGSDRIETVVGTAFIRTLSLAYQVFDLIARD